MKIREIEKNQTVQIDLLVRKIEDKTTKAGKGYVVWELTDGEKTISANMWDMTVEKLQSHNYGTVGSVYLFTITVGEYNGQPNYTVGHLNVSSADKLKFVPHAPLDSQEMFDEMLTMVSKFKNVELARLVTDILCQNEKQLLVWGAAKSVHHDVVGGLLYHMYRMMKMAQVMTFYQHVNQEMLISGVLVHDIGKLKELETDEMGSSNYTTDGYLFGHLYLGAEMVREVGRKNGTNEDIVRQLMHIVVSHHGKLEYGAISKPATPEAMIVNYLDLIDSRAYQFEKIEEELSPGAMSERIYSLDGVCIYRPE